MDKQDCHECQSLKRLHAIVKGIRHQNTPWLSGKVEVKPLSGDLAGLVYIYAVIWLSLFGGDTGYG